MCECADAEVKQFSGDRAVRVREGIGSGDCFVYEDEVGGLSGEEPASSCKLRKYIVPHMRGSGY